MIEVTAIYPLEFLEIHNMSYDLSTIKEEVKAGKAQLFDVREIDEWEDGHLVSAKLVPLSDLQAELNPEGVDCSKTTYLYCRSGQRVFAAQPILEDMGFKNVVPLHEGFDALVSFGYEEA